MFWVHTDPRKYRFWGQTLKQRKKSYHFLKKKVVHFKHPPLLKCYGGVYSDKYGTFTARPVLPACNILSTSTLN